MKVNEADFVDFKTLGDLSIVFALFCYVSQKFYRGIAFSVYIGGSSCGNGFETSLLIIDYESID